MASTEDQRTGRPSKSARAKGRITFTRDDVVRAAMRLLDRDGVDNLSMRSLARELNTGPATLYWHVRDRDELLALILDETVREVHAPAEGTWDQRLSALLHDTRRAILPRPALVAVLWRSGWHLGLETLRIADEATGLVAASGLPEDEVADAYVSLVIYLFGFIFAETTTAGSTYGDEPPIADQWPDFPNLARYGPGTSPTSMDRRFDYGLELLLDGVRARATRTTDHAASGRCSP